MRSIPGGAAHRDLAVRLAVTETARPSILERSELAAGIRLPVELADDTDVIIIDRVR